MWRVLGVRESHDKGASLSIPTPQGPTFLTADATLASTPTTSRARMVSRVGKTRGGVWGG